MAPDIGAFQLRKLVGVGRFELPASWSQTKRSNLAELHPDAFTVAREAGNRQDTALTRRATASPDEASPSDAYGEMRELFEDAVVVSIRQGY